MKFILLVNYERDLRSYEKYYNYLNHKKKRKAIIWLVIGITYILIGSIMHSLLREATDNTVFKMIFLCLGVIQTLVYSHYLLYTLPKHKKKYFGDIERQYQVLTDNNVTQYTLELSDDNLTLDDSLNTAKISWNTLHSYQVFDDILLLHMSKGKGVFYLFNKEELGNEAFKEVIAFVKTKLKER